MEFEWKALYRDNTALSQHREDGTENSYADIDRSRLSHFVILSREPIPRTVLSVHIPENGRLIYRRRIEQWGNGPEDRRTVLLVGCQVTHAGRNSQYVAALFPDGSLEIVDRFQENHPWLYSPKIHEHEGERWDVPAA